MRQIIPPVGLIHKLIGVQKMGERTPYRLTTYSVRVERPEGVLLYHTLTGEMVLLSHDEAEQLVGLFGSVPTGLSELVASWFLVPDGLDDMAMADQIRNISAILMPNEKNALTDYTIFLTTDCNARCFYCYEAGWKKSSMSDQTALRTAKYIAFHRANKPVHIQWFGGEPLLNTRAIDVISNYLRQEGVEFHSTVISNGYLFDEMLVKRAKDTWNLELASIPMDGTETVYNQRKAYVNPQDSPYQRVLRNIGLLIDSGIPVHVRLNMDSGNEKCLYALVDELAKLYGEKPGFGVNLVVLLENTGINPRAYTEEERCTYALMRRSLLDYMVKKGVATKVPLKRGVTIKACVAEPGKSVTVTPDGRLGLCAVCKDGNIWGSVYSDEIDREVLQRWSEHRQPGESCKTCAIYPRCISLKKCPEWSEQCTFIEQRYREDRLRRAVVCAYEDWKVATQDQQEK